jgi:hypothetical protein
MPDKRNGLLLVLMQPPAALEEEFTAWYDTEHIPERANVPGFKTALRFVALSGYPRFMAIYDLDHVSVLDSPEYLAVSGANFSPWTKRVTSRVQIHRIVAEQVFPGDAVTHRSSRMMLTSLHSVQNSEESVVEALRKTFEARSETVHLRIFKAARAKSTDYFCLAGMTPPPAESVDLHSLGALAGAVDLVNMYTPYDLAGRNY